MTTTALGHITRVESNDSFHLHPDYPISDGVDWLRLYLPDYNIKGPECFQITYDNSTPPTGLFQCESSGVVYGGAAYLNGPWFRVVIRQPNPHVRPKCHVDCFVSKRHGPFNFPLCPVSELGAAIDDLHSSLDGMGFQFDPENAVISKIEISKDHLFPYDHRDCLEVLGQCIPPSQMTHRAYDTTHMWSNGSRSLKVYEKRIQLEQKLSDTPNVLLEHAAKLPQSGTLRFEVTLKKIDVIKRGLGIRYLGDLLATPDLLTRYRDKQFRKLLGW